MDDDLSYGSSEFTETSDAGTSDAVDVSIPDAIDEDPPLTDVNDDTGDGLSGDLTPGTQVDIPHELDEDPPVTDVNGETGDGLSGDLTPGTQVDIPHEIDEDRETAPGGPTDVSANGDSAPPVSPEQDLNEDSEPADAPKVLRRDPDDLIRAGGDAINAQMEAKADDYRDKGLSDAEIEERIAADREAAQKEFLSDAFPGQNVSTDVFSARGAADLSGENDGGGASGADAGNAFPNDIKEDDPNGNAGGDLDNTEQNETAPYRARRNESGGADTGGDTNAGEQNDNEPYIARRNESGGADTGGDTNAGEQNDNEPYIARRNESGGADTGGDTNAGERNDNEPYIARRNESGGGEVGGDTNAGEQNDNEPYVARRNDDMTYEDAFSADETAQTEAPSDVSYPPDEYVEGHFGSFEVDQHANGSDYFVKGDHYEDFKADYYSDTPKTYRSYEGGAVYDTVSPSLIEGIHLGEGDVENPGIFWSQHLKGGTGASFREIAQNIPEVRRQLDGGAALEDVRADPKLGQCASLYFAPENMPQVVKCGDYYEFDVNGRHRILAARELGYDIPVKIIGERS